MSRKKRNNDKKKSDDTQFKQDLFWSLKSYGHLFPENKNEVERFEELYGNTPVDIPDNVETRMDMIMSTDDNFESEIEFKIAAFIPSSDDSFNLNNSVGQKKRKKKKRDN
jgi:hypothetical protein